MWKRKSRALAALALLALSARAGTPALSRYEATEPHMGTLFRIVVYAPDAETAHEALRAAFARVGELDGILSDYQPDSELNRVGRDGYGRVIRISSDLAQVLARSQALATQTEGAFDVTVGPVVRLWREARKTGQLPAASTLAAARARTGHHFLHVDERQQTVRLDRPDMQLDVGGIAKGYAADEALKTLRQRGLSRALVAASGDIVAGDAPPGELGWRVAVEPLPGAAARHVLTLEHAAVSTSGDAEQYVEIDGQRYSHIVDPRTGLGVRHRLGATVVARDGATADSVATAVCVLGADRGLALIERHTQAAALLAQPAANGVEVRESTRWRLLRGDAGVRAKSQQRPISMLP